MTMGIYENELDEAGLKRTRARWPESGMAMIAIMGKAGDHRAVWDPREKDEVAAAKATFTKLRAKGYLAYKVKKNGEPGQQITEFDETAGKLIMAPPMQGG